MLARPCLGRPLPHVNRMRGPVGRIRVLVLEIDQQQRLARLGVAQLDPLGKSRPIDDHPAGATLCQFVDAQAVKRDEWVGRKTADGVVHFGANTATDPPPLPAACS